MSRLFFDGWGPITRTLIAGTFAYLVLILILRLSGKRTLSKWNAFDYVVTIALGSILASLILSRSTSLAQGAAALLLLVGLQFIVTWLSVRSSLISHLVKAEPVLLLLNGRFQPEAMRRARVTEGEIRAALRSKGISTLQKAAAVVLETDGSFSVLDQLDEGANSTLLGVRGL